MPAEHDALVFLGALQRDHVVVEPPQPGEAYTATPLLQRQLPTGPGRIDTVQLQQWVVQQIDRPVQFVAFAKAATADRVNPVIE